MAVKMHLLVMFVSVVCIEARIAPRPSSTGSYSSGSSGMTAIVCARFLADTTDTKSLAFGYCFVRDVLWIVLAAVVMIGGLIQLCGCGFLEFNSMCEGLAVFGGLFIAAAVWELAVVVLCVLLAIERVSGGGVSRQWHACWGYAPVRT